MKPFNKEQKEWILKLVDLLFHEYASEYRVEAEKRTKKLLPKEKENK
ncbi:MAG: hypothetical protein GY870_21610 [archaeon]|nr:hypothetical protein [archaeon]